MGLSIWNLFVAATLVGNALAILHEERFLSKCKLRRPGLRGWAQGGRADAEMHARAGARQLLTWLGVAFAGGTGW